MQFEQLLAQVDQSLNNLHFPTHWCQGRTAFGGLSAAMLYRAMKNKITDDREIRSLSTNFVGPLLANTPFNIEVETLREGKSATQFVAKAIQRGQVAVIATACFAKDRASKVSILPTITTTLPSPDAEQIMPFQEGVTPAFFQHMAINVTQGAEPFSSSNTHQLAGWIKLKTTPTHFSKEHIIALTDAWPPTALQMYTQVAPASSMSWYLEFLPHQPLNREQWLGFEAFSHHSAHGYCVEEANLFAQSGELIALSRQTVALFD